MSGLPTTDLYFRNACGDWVRSWRRRAAVRALGANTFVCGDTLLLIRRDEERLMKQALRWPGRLIYLIDDDVAGAAASSGLPDDYRRRLAAFDRAFHRPLVERAAALAVSSPALRAVHSAHPNVTVLDPCWRLEPATVEHHRDVGDSRTNLVHLGSGSHSGALAALTPVIVRLLTENVRTTFTYIARARVHPMLDQLSRARRIEPRTWLRYHRWLGRARFHIGLYPLLDTAFDRSRSINKMIEHVLVGAVGIYPEGWPPAERLGTAARAAPDDPAGWFDVLSRVLADRAGLQDMAAAARRAFPGLNDPLRQRAAWRTLLRAG